MKLRCEHTYEASAAEVYSMLTNPEFRELAARTIGALSAEASFADGRLVVNEVQEVAGVPSFAKKLAGATTVIHTEVWNSAGTSASFEIETPGKPTHIKGSVTLTENAGRTTHAYDLDVTASLPLIGGKIEKLMADLTTKGLDTEHEVGVAWLSASS